MKKLCKVFISFMFLISVSLIFFGCNVEPKTLVKPRTIGIVNNDVYNEDGTFVETEILLVTEGNDSAYKYRFYITDSSDYLNYGNYFTLDSDVNFVKVNDYFKDLKEYHYFVQYIGQGNFKSSPYSKIETFTPQNVALTTPYIQILNNKISWFRIQNAIGYDIYETVLDKNNEVINSSSKIASVASDVFEYDLNTANFNPYYKYCYKVKAIGSGFYNNSEMSNEVYFIKEVTLNKPTNLNVIVEDGKYYLTWSSVTYASKYSVTIDGNNGDPKETTENKYEITDYLNLHGFKNYSFKVNVIESDTIIYNLGEESEVIIYKHTLTLSSPTNILAEQNSRYVVVTFDNVSRAESYTIEFYYNGNLITSNNNLEENSYTLDLINHLGENFNNLTITIKVKANSVSEYILESSFSTINFNVVKIK